MATPAEAVENMLDEWKSDAFEVKKKSDRVLRSERTLLVKIGRAHV